MTASLAKKLASNVSNTGTGIARLNSGGLLTVSRSVFPNEYIVCHKNGLRRVNTAQCAEIIDNAAPDIEAVL